MRHRMKLRPEPFRKIREGKKTIELRLYDEKRQKVQVGDLIEFTNLEDRAKLVARVEAMHRFDSFAEMFRVLPGVAMGFAPNEIPDPEIMLEYYSPEEQALYGVVGIQLSLMDREKVGLEECSRFLSLLLRHRPDVAGISLDEHGWADVQQLLKGINKTRPLSMEDLEKIVATDDKQRYSFNENRTLIRANQGHSIAVDVELEEKIPPDVLWHGTGKKYVESIDASGLVHKSRLYVHLSADTETAYKVGIRHGEPVIYKVLAGQMAKDGYVFYHSANGVWLTKYVPAYYLQKTETET